MVINETSFLSVTQLAMQMGVSRTYVLKLIKQGRIRAQKIGKSYVVPISEIPGIYRPMSESQKKKVEKTLEKTLKEYGEVIKRLGKT